MAHAAACADGGIAGQPNDLLTAAGPGQPCHGQRHLRVATLNSPTTYYQTSSGASGFDFELAQHFAESLGVELELVVVDSHAAALQAVADGKAHVAAAGITVTDIARKRFDFGPTLQTVRAELVYRMGTPSPRRSTTLTAH